jgi:hypothetical protein
MWSACCEEEWNGKNLDCVWIRQTRSQVTELENLSYHSYDRRNSSRLSIANALATSSSYLITSAMKLDKCKKRES